MVLCFASVAKTVLMLHHFFGCCGTVFAFSHGFSSLHSSQSTGTGQIGDGQPEQTKGIFHIPHHLMLSSVLKAW